MSDEKIARLEKLADDHGEKINQHETRHALSDERHKRGDARIKSLEGNWAWLIKTIAAVIIGIIVTVYLKGGAS